MAPGMWSSKRTPEPLTCPHIRLSGWATPPKAASGKDLHHGRPRGSRPPCHPVSCALCLCRLAQLRTCLPVAQSSWNPLLLTHTSNSVANSVGYSFKISLNPGAFHRNAAPLLHSPVLNSCLDHNGAPENKPPTVYSLKTARECLFLI